MANFWHVQSDLCQASLSHVTDGYHPVSIDTEKLDQFRIESFTKLQLSSGGSAAQSNGIRFTSAKASQTMVAVGSFQTRSDSAVFW